MSKVLVKAIEMVNYRNANGRDTRDVREALNSFVETLLHDSRAYSGFSYLTRGEVPEGELPGIEPLDDEKMFPDDSRRFYYTHPKLRKKEAA